MTTIPRATHRPLRRTALLASALLLASTLSACGDTSSSSGGQVPTGSGSATAASVPEVSDGVSLDVSTVARGFDHPWDVGFLPDGSMLVTERPARLRLVRDGEVSTVDADLGDVYVQGEGGLLGMAVHPDFATSRLFTTCQDHAEGGAPVDIRLMTWRLSDDERSATRVKDLLTGLPINPSGRHSGCRPTFGTDGSLWVGTGDTAEGDVPQDRTSLGGKVLRLDADTGKPWKDNPFLDSADPRERFVDSYGHRNIQGVAVQPGTGTIYTAEHGPDKNDEVNREEKGANYGWDPSQGGTVGGYDESVPMTDRQRFPAAVPAVWQSGSTTQAISGATFLSGSAWGKLDGCLAVAALKGAKLLVLCLDPEGAVSSVTIPPALQDFGRLRAPRLGPDGALYLTTDNGSGDRLLKVTPRS